MMPPQNHYQLLGIEPTAPLPTVQSALERLAHEANQMAYTSPDRSRELWESVRQIRGDLLSGSARRQAYDASLQQSRSSVATLERPWSSPASGVPTAPAPAVVLPVSTPARKASASDRHGAAVWPLLVAAAVVALTLGLAFAFHHPGGARPHLVRHRITNRAIPTPSGLTTSGFHKGTGFVSGRRVTMTWHPVRGAVLYHLQVAAVSGAGSGFRHPLLSVLTQGTSRSLKIPGERRYMWRVQALVRGRWSPYAGVVNFLVERPSTSAPQPRPSSTSSIQGDQVRLCWSQVPWAVAYLLRLKPAPAGGDITVHGTCQTVAEKPGTYSWSVAGLVRGTQTYAGPFSVPQRFTVPAPRTAAIVRPRRAVGVGGGGTQGVSKAASSGAPSPVYPRPVTVRAARRQTKVAVRTSVPVPSTPAATSPVPHASRPQRTSVPPPSPPPPPPTVPIRSVARTSVSTPSSYPAAAPSSSLASSTPAASQYRTPVAIPTPSFSTVSTATPAPSPTPSVSYFVSPTALPAPASTTPPAGNPSSRGRSASAPGQTCPGKDDHPGCREGQVGGNRHGP